ncbi:MAG: acetyltransferase-like isoleucine patch superfamily enzyme [Bacteroidia bacterium]|jgi:acetyltransferase-like isoleucine patch superfamily enzyme
MAQLKASGMNRILKLFIPSALLRFLKRRHYLRKYEKHNLMIGVGSDIINVELGTGVFLGADVAISNSSIGDSSYVNSRSQIQHTKIGKFTSIGPNVHIVLGNHPTNFVSTHPTFYANNKSFECFADKMYFEEYGKVDIGNDVWIGQDVIIPGNVKIGDGAIIAPKAVVTKDVEPYAIVGGVPAKHIRYRFDEATRNTLQKDKWWNKDRTWLKENFKKFHDTEIYLKQIIKDPTS